MTSRPRFRVVRLLVPALAAGSLAVLFVTLAPFPPFTLRGGYTTVAAFLFGSEIVTGCLLIGAIDDITVPPAWLTRWRWLDRQFEQIASIGRAQPAVAQAMRHSATSATLPAFLVAFGLMSAAGIAALGIFEVDPTGLGQLSQSELAIGVVVGVTSGILVFAGRGGYVGWIVGATLAALLTQARLAPDLHQLEGTGPYRFSNSAAAWIGFGAILVMIGVLEHVRRRRTKREPGAVPPSGGVSGERS